MRCDAMLPAPLYLSVDEQSFLRGVDEAEAVRLSNLSSRLVPCVACAAHISPSARELRISACARLCLCASMLPCSLVSGYIYLVAALICMVYDGNDNLRFHVTGRSISSYNSMIDLHSKKKTPWLIWRECHCFSSSIPRIMISL